MREQNTKAQEKQNYKTIPAPCPPIHTLIQINPPTPPPPKELTNNKYLDVFVDYIDHIVLYSEQVLWRLVKILLVNNLEKAKT